MNKKYDFQGVYSNIVFTLSSYLQKLVLRLDKYEYPKFVRFVFCVGKICYLIEVFVGNEVEVQMELNHSDKLVNIVELTNLKNN